MSSGGGLLPGLGANPGGMGAGGAAYTAYTGLTGDRSLNNSFDRTTEGGSVRTTRSIEGGMMGGSGGSLVGSWWPCFCRLCLAALHIQPCAPFPLASPLQNPRCCSCCSYLGVLQREPSKPLLASPYSNDAPASLSAFSPPHCPFSATPVCRPAAAPVLRQLLQVLPHGRFLTQRLSTRALNDPGPGVGPGPGTGASRGWRQGPCGGCRTACIHHCGVPA